MPQLLPGIAKAGQRRAGRSRQRGARLVQRQPQLVQLGQQGGTLGGRRRRRLDRLYQQPLQLADGLLLDLQ